MHSFRRWFHGTPPKRKHSHFRPLLFEHDHLAWKMDLDKHHYGEFSMAAVQSNREMEDFSQVEVGKDSLFVGIYDGFKGDACSRYISENIFNTLLRLIEENNYNMSRHILTRVIAETEARFMEYARNHFEEHGDVNIGLVSSSCFICLIWKGMIYVGNIGDSGAILGRSKGVGPLRRLSLKALNRNHNCHNPSIRQELIELHPDDDYIVINMGTSWKVKGRCETSRCIGYAYLKKEPFTETRSFQDEFSNTHERTSSPFARPVLSSRPEVYSRKLKDEDRFIVFGSSGFWKWAADWKMKIVRVANKRPRDKMARRLAMYAMERATAEKDRTYGDIIEFSHGVNHSGVLYGGTASDTRPYFHDDITVIVVFFDKIKPGQERVKLSQTKSFRGHSTEVPESEIRRLNNNNDDTDMVM